MCTEIQIVYKKNNMSSNFADFYLFIFFCESLKRIWKAHDVGWSDIMIMCDVRIAFGKVGYQVMEVL